MSIDLVDYFMNISDFNEDEIDYIKKIGIFKSINKNEHILLNGDICSFVAVIKKGCFRSYYITEEGKDITIRFTFENNFITEYCSFLKQEPSNEYIQAMEHSEVIMINQAEIENMYRISGNFEKVGRVIAEDIYVKVYDRLKSHLVDDAEKRYIRLLNVKPEFFNRIPQHYIASYLGITPETLSRIRKNIDK